MNDKFGLTCLVILAACGGALFQQEYEPIHRTKVVEVVDHNCIAAMEMVGHQDAIIREATAIIETFNMQPLQQDD